ncbi:MAG TPA: hypothetical protein VKU77_06870 [Streptosporangiaceae bacterium]|nr:hypothetical protein [Streptosporangiaceae bacterium]
MPQSLVWDHIRESRRQAATLRQARAARGARRLSGLHARRSGHRLVRGA